MSVRNKRSRHTIKVVYETKYNQEHDTITEILIYDARNICTFLTNMSWIGVIPFE